MANEENKLSRAEMEEIYDAALAANKEIQESGPYSVWGRTASPGTHYTPFSDSLGTGGTGFQDTNYTKTMQILKEADLAYREVGLVRNVVDIMTDFTAEGLNVHHPVAAQERFYRAWMKKTQMEELAKQTLRSLYKWANVGIFRFWGKIRPKTRREMMAKARQLFSEGKDQEAIKAFFREDKIFKRGLIPVRYSCLPPFRLRITGSLLFDTRNYFYNFTNNEREKMLNPVKYATPEEKKLMVHMPEQLKLQIQKDARVHLPEHNFTMIHYKRDCSRLWADPIILPIMNDLRYKQILRRLDISVAESIMNPITVFKLGNTVEGYAPTKEQFQNLSNLLKTPVATKTLVWTDLIEVEQHIVDAKEVFTMEKYHEVDLDILNGLGISHVLLNGGVMGAGSRGGAGASAFLSVRTLLERLEDGRQEFMKFLNKELEMVRLAMGWKTVPKITWDQMNLRDEAAEKRILIELLDRKIISAESALDQLGFDSTIEMARKIREDKTAEKSGIPHSVGPFEEAARVQKDEDPARLSIDVQKEGQEMQAEQAEKQMKQNEDFKKQDVKIQKEVQKERIRVNKQAPKAGPGRPGGRGDPDSRKQKKKRDTKPQGMGSVTADLIEQSLANRAVIEHYFKPRFLKMVGKDNLRKLTKNEKELYQDMIKSIWGFASPKQEISPEWVEQTATELTEGKAPLNRKVHAIHANLKLDYRTEHLKAPDLRTDRELFAKAQILFEESS